jgi:hypothetical protein
MTSRIDLCPAELSLEQQASSLSTGLAPLSRAEFNVLRSYGFVSALEGAA